MVTTLGSAYFSWYPAYPTPKTRMWGIDPRLLCDQHLLGEHSEMHQIVGTIKHHPHGDAIVRGHAEKQQLDTTQIQARHNALAAELTRRDMTHNSPLAYDDALALGTFDIDANRIALQKRCSACHDRMQND